jgi:thiazolylpeptide-type bacteriocin precursor
MSNALMEELLNLETTTFEVADISDVTLGKAEAITICSTSGCSACATCVDS